jgi:ABC-2 type transport system ATP-binding protein
MTFTHTNTAAPAVAVTGLRKSWGDHVVLDGIDFSVAAGTVYALLGPNGAGKTTTVQVLTTLIRPDAGTAPGSLRVLGHDVVAEPDLVRAGIGVTGQFSAVDELLSGRENLRLMCALNHLGRREGRATTEDLLERFELVDAADKPASRYSGGMKRRLDLAMTLVGSPRLLFLDEPTAGLDPRSRHAAWGIVRGLVADGVTVFLTTQYLEEADQLADRVAVLDGGRIVAEGTPEELKRQVPGGHVELVPADGSAAFHVPYDGTVSALRDVLARVDAEGTEIASVSVHTPDLDDVFLALTGHPAPDSASDTTPEEVPA